MCLVIKSGTHTAKKPFYVLKMVYRIEDKDCRSLYQHFGYTYGSNYTSLLIRYGDRVEEGLHSLLVKDIHKSGWGFHSASYACGSGFMGWDLGFILCKVPKGSTYYLGDDGDVCSDQLEVLFPVISTKENSKAIEDGITIPHLDKEEFFKMAAQWVIDAGYNIKPS